MQGTAQKAVPCLFSDVLSVWIRLLRKDLQNILLFTLYLKQGIIHMTIGDRLKYIRIQRKKTLEEVAAAVGVNPTSISKYETNRIKNIPQKKLEELARYFDVSIYYILGLTDPGDASPLILSIDEQMLVEDYRKLSHEDQVTVQILVKRLLEVASDPKDYVQLTL